MDKLSELIQEIEQTELTQVTYEDLLATISVLTDPFGTIPEFKYNPLPRKELDVGFFYCPYIPVMRNPTMGVAMAIGA